MLHAKSLHKGFPRQIPCANQFKALFPNKRLQYTADKLQAFRSPQLQRVPLNLLLPRNSNSFDFVIPQAFNQTPESGYHGSPQQSPFALHIAEISAAMQARSFYQKCTFRSLIRHASCRRHNSYQTFFRQ